jgi:hypothetical protein
MASTTVADAGLVQVPFAVNDCTLANPDRDCAVHELPSHAAMEPYCAESFDIWPRENSFPEENAP